MKVADVMTGGIVPLAQGTSVQEAATQMAELDVGALLVGTPEAVAGLVTDRDILIRVVVEGRDPKAVTVDEVMSRTLFSCRPDDTLDTAFAEMRERQVRRLPVIDSAGRLCGIVTLSDLSNKGDQAQTAEKLRAIAEPHRLEGAAPISTEPGAVRAS
jgi:CBS domain-containing protein